MNMYIYPKYLEEASKPHWTVKLLRVFSVIQILTSTLLGFLYSGPITYFIGLSGVRLDSNSGLVVLLGVLVGLMVGIMLSAGTFAAALVVDDIHTMRQHSEALVAFETENPKWEDEL